MSLRALIRSVTNLVTIRIFRRSSCSNLEAPTARLTTSIRFFPAPAVLNEVMCGSAVAKVKSQNLDEQEVDGGPSDGSLAVQY